MVTCSLCSSGAPCAIHRPKRPESLGDTIGKTIRGVISQGPGDRTLIFTDGTSVRFGIIAGSFEGGGPR